MLRIVKIHKVYIVVNRVGRSRVPAAAGFCRIRREDMNTSVRGVEIPGLAGSDIVIEYERFLLC